MREYKVFVCVCTSIQCVCCYLISMNQVICVLIDLSSWSFHIHTTFVASS